MTPPLTPTTLHRHPERLKRWAAINAMIRQKNQAAIRAANEKTTNEDNKKTNKKRKNDDIDKSLGYSTLSWEDINLFTTLTILTTLYQAIFLMLTSLYSLLVLLTCGTYMDKSLMGKKP